MVSPSVKERIERLQEKNDDISMTDVVRRALALYEEFLNIRDEGSRLVVEGSDGSTETLRII